MSEDLDVADVLERAADVLMMLGRTKGIGCDDGGRRCAMGAIEFVTPEWAAHRVEKTHDANPRVTWRFWFDHPAAEAFGAYLDAHGLARITNCDTFKSDAVWRFNDATDDDGEVIDHMRRCAKELREQEAA